MVSIVGARKHVFKAHRKITFRIIYQRPCFEVRYSTLRSVQAAKALTT